MCEYVTQLSTVDISRKTLIMKVTAPHEIFDVTEEDEDMRKRTKFAKKHIPYYNPRAGYGYFEFKKPTYVLPERNIIGLKKVIIISNNNIVCMYLN